MARSKLSWEFIKTVFFESLRGKTLARILLNHALSEIEVAGKILDLGSSKESASYNRFLQYQTPYEVTRTDFFKSGPGLIQLDLEKPFYLPDTSFDAVTCFNVLEHLYNYRNCIAESYRVLKPGGVFVGSTPFLVNYHADPHDYFRYTHEAIEKMFGEAGFATEKIISLGFGPFSVAALYITFALPTFLHCLVLIPAIFMDALVLRFKPSQHARYQLGYVFIFKKP